MRNLILLLFKDFRRRWKHPAAIIGFLLLPLVFTFIFGLVFGSQAQESLPQISVLATDKDNSLLSQLFLTGLTQGDLKNMIALKKVSEEKGRRQLNKGKASALIIIPENFGRNLLNGQPTEIILLKNPSEQFLPQIVEEVADVSSLLLSSLFSVFSDEISQIKDLSHQETLPDSAISDLSIQIKNRMEGIAKYVFPPVIGLKQETIQEEGKKETVPFSIHGYILPAMAILFLLFICNAVFEDILREKEKGTLLRLSISPMRISEFIWSKILVAVSIGIICTLFLILLGYIAFGIPWGNLLHLILVVLSLNILIAGFISIFYSFVRTERQAGAVLSSVILVMSLLGGSMVPVDVLPPFFLNFSKLTVNYWGIEAFHRVMFRATFAQILPLIAGMAVAGFILAGVASFWLRNNLRRGLIK
ncbi:MAG: ABC transporter permease [Candidatus Aminicenantales bacterium]